MELSKVKELLGRVLGNRKAVQLAFVLGMAGIALIWISSWAGSADDREEPVSAVERPSAEACRQQLEASLKRVVTAVTGEPSPEVMVTLENAGSSLFAADETESRQENGSQREHTHVILEDGGGAQHGLAVAELQPEVKGVVIVSRAAADPAVREQLVNAARTALGVPSNRVCVVPAG